MSRRPLRKVVRDFAEGEIAPHAEALGPRPHVPRRRRAGHGRPGPVRHPLPRGVRRRRAPTSPRCASPSRSSAGSTSRWPSRSRPASAWAPTRSSGSAPRSSASGGCPTCAPGGRSAGFGLTEPDAGSDAGGTRTTAVLEGDEAATAAGEWVIDGEKAFITNSGTPSRRSSRSPPAPAGRAEAPPRSRRSSSRRAPRASPSQPPYRKMGWHASDTHGLTLRRLPGARGEPAGRAGPGLRPVPRRSSTRAASPSPPWPSASSAAASSSRWPTPASARPSAGPSAPTRRWRSPAPTWP